MLCSLRAFSLGGCRSTRRRALLVLRQSGGFDKGWRPVRLLRIGLASGLPARAR